LTWSKPSIRLQIIIKLAFAVVLAAGLEREQLRVSLSVRLT
jgi:hypothetical protein